jgi:hypothetical protein
VNGQFKLVGHEPVAVSDLMEWAMEFENIAKRVVAQTQCEDSEVSTVFLGLDHNFSGRGAPVLFETMVFGGTHDGEQERYCTWDEAEAGHRAMVARIEGGTK